MHRGDIHLTVCSSLVLKVNGIDRRLGGTKDYEICICYFLKKYAAFKEKAKECIGS